MDKKKDRKQMSVKQEEVIPVIEVEIVKPPIRFLGDFPSSTNVQGNVGDTLYNTGTSKLMIRRNTGRFNVA